MSLSPELSIALPRITACNKSERLLMVVRDDLIKSLQAGQTAVNYAHEAWMQLERLGADVMSIGRLVGFVDRDKCWTRGSSWTTWRSSSTATTHG